MASRDIRGGPIGWMAHNSVAANLLMAVILVGGVLTGFRVQQEVFPETDLDTVTVTVPYPGASPEEVEQGIVRAIEDRIRGLDGIERIRSTSMEGRGVVFAELLTGYDDQGILTDVKNEVDRITSFPEDAEEPIVKLETNRQEVMAVAVHGEQDEATLKELAERFRDRLLQDEGITQVELGMVREPEISVEVPQEALRRYGLTLPEIAQRIEQTSVKVPGGELETEAGQILVRTDERRDLGPEFRDVPLTTRPNGTDVRLGDVADIEDGFREHVDQSATFDGESAAMVRVFRVGDQTPVGVAESVQAQMEPFLERQPQGIDLSIVRDRSTMYQGRVNLLLKNGYLGLLLVLVVLGLFLQLRLAFWVTLGILISFAGGVLLMPAMGVSLNMISLFAFIVTLGLVVDDAIVVGENIYEYHERGLPPMRAAVEATREVAGPVTFAILTTIAAFSPMFAVPGFVGKFFWVIPAIVVSVLAISLVEAFFVLPAHLGHTQRVPERGVLRMVLLGLSVPLVIFKPVLWFFERSRLVVSRGLRWWLDHVFEPLVRLSLRQRYLTLALGIAVLLSVVGLVAGGRLPFSFMPNIESDRVSVEAELPNDVPLERTRAVRDRLVDAAKEVLDQAPGGEGVSRGIYAQIGARIRSDGPDRSGADTSGSHTTNVQVRLVEAGEREITAEGFVEKWRKRVGSVPNVESLSFSSSVQTGAGAPIDVELAHRDVETLERAARELGAKLRKYDGVHDVDDGFSRGKPQLDFTMKPAAESLGVTAADLARQLRGAFFGSEAVRQQRGRDELRVYVRLPDEQRRSRYHLERMLVRTPNGGEVPLGIAADVERGRAPTTIERAEGRRVLNVTADVDEQTTSAGEVIGSLTSEELPALRSRYSGLTWSFQGEQREQRKSLASLGQNFLLAMLVIYGLLAVPFRSYAQPLVVMAAIPFGMVGAVLGHVLMGFNLSVISMMGMVALAGVVVNDSLVLVVAANRLRDDGTPPLEAILGAARRRLRPILLTSLTTFFGLMPMIFETSMQARFLIPMAISLGYGMLFATVIILGLVPTLYLIVEDLVWLLGLRSREERDADEEADDTEPTTGEGEGTVPA